MSDTRFRALWITEQPDKTFTRALVERERADLPQTHDTLVRVRFSSLNYKDALSASGNRGVTRNYPHTPGIDAAGEIVASADPALSPGQPVIVTSHDLGMNTPGGFGQYIRVPAAWVVPLPDGLSLHDSMAYGTAGLTAALCLRRLQAHGVMPEFGEVLVTGATGGVGSLAVATLAALGYSVAAVTGKSDAADWLKALGARAILSRAEATENTRPLLKERWAGVIDTVGGEILATALKSTKRDGCVACCGLVQSAQFPATVFPFILRGVTLTGVDSVEIPSALRRQMWANLAGPWSAGPAALAAIARDVALDELAPEIDTILRGGMRGRVVVAL